tara:strand:- start:4889 stop:5806 length:918 start_codon:yes stop_codon:yes gene_type:complete
MKVLILTGRKSRSVIKLQKAFDKAGFEKVDYLNISKLNLISRGGKTQIVNDGINVSDYDAIYLRARLNLSPFIEPLLDELKEEGVYVQFMPGAFYLNGNEALQIAALSSKEIPITKSVLVVDPSIIKDSAEKFSYPLIFKSYVGQKKTQSILIESPRSLRSITKSIKMDLDAAIVREFEEGDLIQCTVIGSKVFGIRRKWNGTEIESLAKGKSYNVSDKERSTAIRAALACGCEIATVKLSKGVVTEVMHDVHLSLFSKKTSQDLFAVVAEHFKRRIKGVKIMRPKPVPSLLDKLKRIAEGILNG